MELKLKLNRVSQLYFEKSQKPLKKKGVLSSPDPKPGRTMDLTTLTLVTEFYESDIVSQMAGKKTFIISKIRWETCT